MYKKITGQILGIFFIFCGIGCMIVLNGPVIWPITALFMLAGFMAIPLPDNRKLLILRYVLYLGHRELKPVSNMQLQAMRIAPWPCLAFSFVIGGIAMYMATEAIKSAWPALIFS